MTFLRLSDQRDSVSRGIGQSRLRAGGEGFLPLVTPEFGTVLERYQVCSWAKALYFFGSIASNFLHSFEGNMMEEQDQLEFVKEPRPWSTKSFNKQWHCVFENSRGARKYPEGLPELSQEEHDMELAQRLSQEQFDMEQSMRPLLFL